MRSKRDKANRIKIHQEGKATRTSKTIVASVFKTISDPPSLELFKCISEAGSDSSDLMKKTRLSRRRYYSRLSAFTKNGIVIKKNKKNYTTTFGRVVYHTLMTVENAFVDYYKLKAIDSIGLYSDIPEEEHKKIIATLITDPNIREILFSIKDKHVIKNGMLIEP